VRGNLPKPTDIDYCVRRHAIGLLTLFFAAGCAAGGGSRSVPPVIASASGSPDGLKVPAKLSLPVPPDGGRAVTR